MQLPCLDLEAKELFECKQNKRGGNGSHPFIPLVIGRSCPCKSKPLKKNMSLSLFFTTNDYNSRRKKRMVFSEKSFKPLPDLASRGAAFGAWTCSFTCSVESQRGRKKTGNFGFPFVQCYQGGLNHHPKLLARSRFGGSKDCLELFLTLMNLGEKIIQSNQLK